MTRINKPNWLLTIGSVMFVFIVCCIIAIHPAFNSNQFVSTGIAVDLTITAPFLYFLFIRKTAISKITVFRVFIIGVLLASFLLHDKHIFYLITIKKWIVPIIECVTISLILYKFYRAKKEIKNNLIDGIDFLQHCRIVLLKMFYNEKISNILASEFAVLFYTFKWRKSTVNKNAIVFSYHKTGNTRLVLSTFIGLIFVETLGFHFLLTSWSRSVAWIFTALSFYTCLQLFAHIKAMKCRSILVLNDMLYLHNGLAGDVNIDIENISQMDLVNKNIIGKDVVKLCLLKGLEKHNIAIYLKQPVDVVRMFGIKKEASVILLHVDNPPEFVFAIENKLEELIKTRN